MTATEPLCGRVGRKPTHLPRPGKPCTKQTLLKLYDEERLLDAGWAPRTQYKRLEHPGLAEQLRPYIVDGGKSLSARRVAIDIAEACVTGPHSLCHSR